MSIEDFDKILYLLQLCTAETHYDHKKLYYRANSNKKELGKNKLENWLVMFTWSNT